MNLSRRYKLLITFCSLILLVIFFQNCAAPHILISGSSQSLVDGATNVPPVDGALPSLIIRHPPDPTDPNANPKLLAIPPNTALDLGPYKCDQPTDGTCAAGTDYSRFTYDSVKHQILFFGGGHGLALHTDVQVFDFGKLKWSAQTPSTLCSEMSASNINPDSASWISSGQPWARHTWDMGVMAMVNGVRKYIILTSGGVGSKSAESCIQTSENTGGAVAYPPGNAKSKINIYDSSTGTWSFGKNSPDALWYYASSAETDPVTNKIIVVIGDGGSVYDPDTDTVIAHFPTNNAFPGYSNNLVYFPPNQKMYYVMRGTTSITEITLDRNDWSKTKPVMVNTSGPETEESGWAYDSVNQVIGGGVKDGNIYLYEPITNTWTTKAMLVQSDFGMTSVGSMPSSSHVLDFDSKDGVFIFIANGHTWAYRYR